MRVFHNCTTFDTRNAARAIRERKTELGFGDAPWSLAELDPDDEDFGWLMRWVADFRWTSDAGGALVLLFWFSEFSRRDAQKTGELWHTIWDSLPLNVQERMTRILGRGGPTEELKDFIRRAVRHETLRNVTDEPGQQAWYGTVQLQYGCSVVAAETALANWLQGAGRPHYITRLLDPQSGSTTFRRLWNTLIDIGTRRVTEEVSRRQLSANCWTPPGAVDAMIAAARAAQLRGIERLETRAPFAVLRLRWSDAGAGFHCELGDPPRDELRDVAEDVGLFVNGKRLARLLWCESVWQWSKPTIRLAAESPNVQFELRTNADQPPILVRDLKLWAEDTVTLFRFEKDGKLATSVKDAWDEEMDRNEECVVVAPGVLDAGEQLRCEGAFDEHEVGSHVMRRLRCTRTAGLFVGANEFWRPRVVDSEPRVVVRGDVVLEQGATWGANARLRIPRLNLGTEPKTCFLHGSKLTLQPTPDGWLSEEFPFRPRTQQTTLRGSVAFARGPSAALVARASMRCAALLGPETEVPLDGAVSIEAETLRKAGVAFWWDDPHAEWELWEGSLRIGSFGSTPLIIREPEALGAPLQARRPAAPNRPPLGLSGPVVQRGVVASVNVGANELEIVLARPIEPRKHHKVVLWAPTEDPVLVAPTVVPNDPKRWRVPLSGNGISQVAALAVAFRGAWIGGQCLNAQALDGTILNTAEPRYSHRLHAALLRWFRIPVLQSPLFERLRMSVCKHPVDYIQAWSPGPWSTRWLDPRLDWGVAPSAPWLAVFRALMLGNWPRDEKLLVYYFGILKTRLGIEDPDEARTLALQTLLDADPILAALTARAKVRHDTIGAWKRAARNRELFAPGPNAAPLNGEAVFRAKAMVQGTYEPSPWRDHLLLHTLRNADSRKAFGRYLFY